MNITGKTQVLGIFGHPVEHSFSPPMHNQSFHQLGIDHVYIPLPVEPANLQKAVEGFRAMGFLGANVTIPHKTEIGQYLDALDPIAQLTGSVNTLYWKDNLLRGTTTDPFGALENLRRADVDLHGKQLAIIGYGGAARAIAFEICLQYPEQTLIIQGRNPQKAQKLIDEINLKIPDTHNKPRAVYVEDYQEMSDQAEVIINCTSLGMHPNEDSSPCDAHQFHKHQVIYDIVYAPRETKWMREASQQGCQVVGGLGMLVYQGFKSFKLWTGQEPPVEEMFQAINHL